jgi:hypothetical protein
MRTVWIAVGVALVGGAYLLAPENVDPWPALNQAGIAAAGYLLFLILFVLRKPFSKRARVIVAVIAVLFVASTYMIWTGMDEQSHWQRNQLRNIGSVIQQGIAADQMHTPLLALLESVHNQRGRRRLSVDAIFGQSFPNAKPGSRMNEFNSDPEFIPITYYLESVSDGQVSFIGQSPYRHGVDSEFKNYDGATGRLQVRAVLTEKGVAYESQN